MKCEQICEVMKGRKGKWVNVGLAEADWAMRDGSQGGVNKQERTWVTTGAWREQVFH